MSPSVPIWPSANRVNGNRVLAAIVRRVVDIARPERIILFGSRARGKARRGSDYDILVVKSGNYSRRKLAMKLHRRFFGIPASVDVLVATPEMLEKYKTVPALIYFHILREGHTVYASE